MTQAGDMPQPQQGHLGTALWEGQPTPILRPMPKFSGISSPPQQVSHLLLADTKSTAPERKPSDLPTP